jgi:UDP:flavonoid glycosyltransferase YjiC (YdhE family)
MRILFTPMAWPSHYYPMMGLVWACRAAGHAVRVAGQPVLTDAVVRTGGMLVPVGGAYDFMAGVADAKRAADELAREEVAAGGAVAPVDPMRHRLRLIMAKHIRMAEDMLPDLAAFTRWWRPDIVVSDPLVYAAPPAAAAVDAVLVRHLWGVDNAREIGLPGNGVSEEDDPRAAWPEELVDLYGRYGAKPQADVAARTLDICPESMQLPGVPNRLPVRFVPYNGSGVVPPWLFASSDRLRVCVTWGGAATAVLGAGGFLVPEILDALSGLAVDVVVTLNAADRARLTGVPDGVRVVEDMPLDMLLPTCSAIVHASGAGTTLSAALHGVPQLTIPQLPGGQDLTSAQLARTGAGIELTPAEADVPAIRAAVATLLSSAEVHDAARRLREEMLAAPSLPDTVQVLETLR